MGQTPFLSTLPLASLGSLLLAVALIASTCAGGDLQRWKKRETLRRRESVSLSPRLPTSRISYETFRENRKQMRRFRTGATS
jgi:hypothetical protein